jgi:predicted lipid-binding transport protein (Tim44 family)
LPTQSPPVSRTHAHAHSPPQASSNVQLQTTSPEPVARSRRWRGCLVGCLLLILLCGLLFLGGPFVLNVLREEQRQRSLESPPLQTR